MDLTTNGLSKNVALTNRFIGRPGAVPALDPYPAAELDRLAGVLELGVPSDAVVDAEQLAGFLKDALDEPSEHDDEAAQETRRSRAAAEVGERAALSYVIDRNKLTDEYLAFTDGLAARRGGLDPTAQQILGRDRLLEFLFLRARFVEGLEQADGILRNVISWKGGLRPVHGWAVARSLTRYCADNAMEVTEAGRRRVLAGLIDPPVPLVRQDFQPRLKQLLQEYVYGKGKVDIVHAVQRELGILDSEIAKLVQYLNGAPYVTKENAKYYLAPVIAELRRGEAQRLPTPADDQPLESDDFTVSYYDEQTTALQFDRTSVEAAAQLFYVMVWGDELGVFEVIDRIAAQREPHLRLSIRKREVADDLTMYVFDQQFRNLRSGKTCRRVEREERQMYYRQVFGVGRAPVTEAMDVNTDFPTLWGVLMREVKDYIVRTEAKQGAVSKQRVYQAIEDLQYNLSTACSGIAKVAAPIMYREMDFVIRRLLGSDDLTSQLSKEGPPSFMKVVENVRGVRGLNPLRNKGMIGHQILALIAAASPALVDDTRQFDAFIQAVEAYIVTLGQMGGTEQEVAEDDPGEAAQPPPTGDATPEAGKEWSF